MKRTRFCGFILLAATFTIAIAAMIFFKWPRKIYINLSDDNLSLSFYQNGKKQHSFPIAKDSKIFADLSRWTEDSTKDFKPVFNTYAPRLLVTGKDFRIDFHKTITIISVRNSPDSVWNQYSRASDTEDNELENILEKFALSQAR